MGEIRQPYLMAWVPRWLLLEREKREKERERIVKDERKREREGEGERLGALIPGVPLNMYTRSRCLTRDLCLFLCVLSACVLEEGGENGSTAQPPLTDLMRSPFAIALSCP
jgi:hypothetical protein